MIKKRNISSLISKAFILCLYISFLAVQLFFNFDIGKGPATPINYYSFHPLNKTESFVNQPRKLDTKKATVFLNKRFQPESILIWNTIEIEAPVKYIETQDQYVSFDQHIAAIHIHTRSLRGPPTIA